MMQLWTTIPSDPLSGRRLSSAIHKRALGVGCFLTLCSVLLQACSSGSAAPIYQPVQQFSSFFGGGVQTLDWSSDSKYVAAGFINPQVLIWAMPGGQQVDSLGDFGGRIGQVAWSPHTTQVAVLADQPQNGLQIWEPLTKQRIAILTAAHLAGAMAWSPDGAFLAITVPAGIQIYETTQWQLVHTLPCVADIAALSWAPDGHMLAVSRNNDLVTGFLDLWDVAQAQRVQAIPWSAYAGSLTWSPNGQFLAAQGTGDSVQIWDVKQQQISAILKQTGLVQDVHWASDGQRLAVTDADKIEIWAPATGTLLTTIPYTHNATAARWSPDSAYLAVAGLLGEVTVYTAK